MIRSTVLVLSSFVLTSTLIAQIRPSELLNIKVVDADHRLTYGPDALQFGELRVPKANGPHPVAVIIHGGCWADHLSGLDARATAYDLLRPLAAALTDSGIATWNVEYRRAGNAGGGWPGTFQDLAAATDFLKKAGPQYNLDLRKVVVAGHSAGGQLALWIAARAKLPSSSPLYIKDPLQIKSAVNIDGPPDLASFQPVERNICGNIPAVTNFLGGTPSEQPQAYREGSAQSFLPLGVPQLIAAGGLLLRQSELFAEYERTAKNQGDSITVLRFDGANHFDMLNPDAQHGKMLIDAIATLTK